MLDFDFSGTHVIADVYDIEPQAVSDESRIVAALAEGITRSGATICGMQTKRFEPAGFTAMFLLSESHVSVHTYPDQNSLFFDAFTCGSRCNPERVIDHLIAALGECSHRVEIIKRGGPGEIYTRTAA
ncbi:S-adenosylmethionine decarboxylase [Actinocrispum wychmicini]|uniref:S-adenosylmethionine decarboxylase n=2 Tax=Actinocrispum wychmicini TaxID=1213861 RepID=A0A4R2JT93_9PSEU|nr:S-adenosylmethionine decarboxylase [Actinocrispum wychmicini]